MQCDLRAVHGRGRASELGVNNEGRARDIWCLSVRDGAVQNASRASERSVSALYFIYRIFVCTVHARLFCSSAIELFLAKSLDDALFALVFPSLLHLCLYPS